MNCRPQHIVQTGKRTAKLFATISCTETLLAQQPKTFNSFTLLRSSGIINGFGTFYSGPEANTTSRALKFGSTSVNFDELGRV